MSGKASPCESLRLRPAWSRQLLAFWASVFGGALSILAALPLPWLVRLGLLAPLCGYGILSLATHWWRRMPWSIMEASLGPDGWELVLATGEAARARLLPSSYIGQRLMVLRFSLGGWRRLSLPLAADSLNPELTRRLRVALRTTSGSGTPGIGHAEP